jgi:hypothetical protein
MPVVDLLASALVVVVFEAVAAVWEPSPPPRLKALLTLSMPGMEFILDVDEDFDLRLCVV